jgi:UDP-N-acetylmuramoyl-tripeptide--D-alanyl-D-alanine ligase
MTLAIILCLMVGALVAAPFSIGTDFGILKLLAGVALVDFLLPTTVLVACTVAVPIEKSIQNGFKRQARNKLASMPHLQIIAITGSYGKTSIKFAIAEILKQRFNVLATPGSFNTPMGICLVINRDLKPEHQILILEMGARYVGDIQELCDIARPDIGIVTNVGIAHLETFGSQQNIAMEKGVLVENVDAKGFVVLNGDDTLVREMQSRTKAKVVFAGLESPDSDL